MRRGAIFLAMLRTAMPTQCGFQYGNAATYDLTGAMRIGLENSYVITDGDIPCTPTKEKNFTWIFNVCDDVTATSVPAACANEAPASVFQVDKMGTHADLSDDKCSAAGYLGTDQSNEWSLLSSSDPSAGVMLTYFGSYCALDAEGNNNPVQRRTDLKFTCTDSGGAHPTTAYEESHCHYSINIPSWDGCPTQCPIAGRHLCAGNGHCRYDANKKVSRCMCDTGYTGEDCATLITKKKAKEHNSGASTAITVFIVILFVVTLILSATLLVMVRQLRAYKMDASHYSALQGDNEEDGVTSV
mmetsp:Transcript_49122/g.66951  ORF Transcript_49122/g.66951 Transcript_49122/m.66951 type:complete len:300 (-) Transcript_49122:126-1025(-)